MFTRRREEASRLRCEALRLRQIAANLRSPSSRQLRLERRRVRLARRPKTLFCRLLREPHGWHFLSLLKTLLVTNLGGKFRQVRQVWQVLKLTSGGPNYHSESCFDFWRPQLPQRVMKSTSGGHNYHSESPITTASHQLQQRVIKCAKKSLPLQRSRVASVCRGPRQA